MSKSLICPNLLIRNQIFMMNPLLDFSALPRFSEIKPEHVNPAVEQLIAEARAAITQVEK